MTRTSALLAGALALLPAVAEAGQNDILVGLDGKAFFDANGIRVGPGGNDALVVMDVSDPANPRIRASLPLANSLVGPPTNLQITPDGRLALLASSVVTNEKDGAWSTAPDRDARSPPMSRASNPASATSVSTVSLPSGSSPATNMAGRAA